MEADRINTGTKKEDIDVVMIFLFGSRLRMLCSRHGLVLSL